MLRHAFRPTTLAPAAPRAFAAHRSLTSRVVQDAESKDLIPIRTNLRGSSLLNTARLNKGAAFSREERAVFGLEGFLPYDVHTLDRQADRAWRQLTKQPTVLLQHAFLQSLRDQNQVLFYRLMQDHLKELLGVLYTPGAADAVANYSKLFRRPIGCFIDGMRTQLAAHLKDVDRTADVANHSKSTKDMIDLVVVTDSEAILGIGDQGVGGITISTSKAALYTLGAGINPNRILPVVLDVGTDNHALFSDPLYMGWKRSRLRGKNYDDFVDRFVRNCRKLFPNAIIHFEDFGMANAYKFLEKYKGSIPMFNDDIQGTGAVTLAAIVSALKVSGTQLADQRIVIYGAGSAGLGIADQIRDGLMILGNLSKEDAERCFWCVDRDGLLVQGANGIRGRQKDYARPAGETDSWARSHPEQPNIRLEDVVRHVHPTILIGTSTHSRAFDEDLVREMARHVERPIIFPLSNPTSLAEADPSDILAWTDGRALVATGSPFPPAHLPATEEGGPEREVTIAQTNNALVYPALGLGAILARSQTISDHMLMAGVHALARLSPALQDPTAALLPDLHDVREVSVHVAAAVVRQAVQDGNALDETTIAVANGKGELSLEDYIRGQMWDPVYRPLELVD